ncbi:MAG: hypothetical protein AAGD18_20340 [Actinomycetota bacterium]
MGQPENQGASTERRAWWLLAGLAIAITLVLAACGGSGDGADAEADAETPSSAPGTEAEAGAEALDVSFSRDIQPVLAETCARCHTGEGPGTAHFLLETAADAEENALFISDMVQIRAMPPWPASGLGVELQHDWSLDDDQIEAIIAWNRAGGEIDVDPTMPFDIETLPTLDDADVTLSPATGGYDGEAGQPDEYRCYVYDPGLTETAWLDGYEFVPDQTEVVHHAVGYLVDAELAEQAAARDGEDGQPGWSCFGSSGLRDDELFLGWAPGQGPTELPSGSGMPLDAGDFLVIQVHYHYEEDAPEDLSQMRLRWSDDPDPARVSVESYLAPAEIPCGPDESGPLCDRDAAIDAAIAKYGVEGTLGPFITQSCGFEPDDFVLVDGVVSGECDQSASIQGQILGVFGHAHELGSAFRMTQNPGEDDERVLLDIDRWDFDWQFVYEPVEELFVAGDDTIRIECTWDRNLRDPQLEPAYIVWADGTDDEMCFATLMVLEG